MHHTTRRRFLKTATGAAVATPFTGHTAATDVAEVGITTGQRVWSQRDSADLPRRPAPTHTHHLASSLSHVEADPHGSHEFRLAGTFAVTDGTRLPPQHTGSIRSQTVRIVNETPEVLAVTTSPNPHETAFAPKLINVQEDDWLRRFGQITTVLSFAAQLLSLSTPATLLGSAGLAASLVTSYLDGTDDALPNGVYQWHGQTDPTNDLQGGHHLKFGVNEYRTGADAVGSILVASQTLRTNNVWRLRFNDGLRDVTPLDPEDLSEEEATTLTPQPIEGCGCEPQPHRNQQAVNAHG